MDRTLLTVAAPGSVEAAAAGGVHAGHVICVVGVSGVGKDTLIRAVEKLRPNVRKPVSATTRPKRPGEIDGVDYFFVSGAEFARLQAAGLLLEWTSFDGHLYGTLLEQLVPGKDGQVVLCHRENDGAKVLKDRLGAYLVGILPPSWDAVAKRLRDRGDDAADIEARLQLDMARTDEIRRIADKLIVNDDLTQATAELVAVVDALSSIPATR